MTLECDYEILRDDPFKEEYTNICLLGLSRLISLASRVPSS